MELSLLESICILLSGLAIFLLGMKNMGDGLQRSAGVRIRKMFSKLSNKGFVMYGLGAGTTALVQSSGATVIMSMGFVAAGMMTSVQAGAFILGARLGTTITGVLVSLSSFSITPIIMALAVVGVGFLIFAKNNEPLQIAGTIITGFGILFVGMYLMKISINSNVEMTTFFTNTFKTLSNPFLLFLLGIVFTALLQSSSSVASICIVMVTAGTLSVESGMCILIGATVGTCFTPLVASIGARLGARKAALFDLFSAIIGAIVIGIPALLLRSYIYLGFKAIISSGAWQLSLFGVAYSLVASLVLLPFVKPITKFVDKICKEKKKNGFSFYYIDEKFIKSPAVAVAQAKSEVANLGKLAKVNLDRAVNALVTEDLSEKDTIGKSEEEIDFLTKSISDYLIKLAGEKLNITDENFIGSLHHVIDDLERIGDHAWDFYKEAKKMKKEDLHFTDSAKEEIKSLKVMVDELYESSMEVFISRNEGLLREVNVREALIDASKKEFADSHVKRLAAGECSVETGTFFYTAIASLERIGDHLENVAFSIKSATGYNDEKQAAVNKKQ